MKREMSASDLGEGLDEWLDAVANTDDEIVILRAGHPTAALIPIHRYEALERGRERLFALIDEARARNADVPPDVIEAEVAEAVRAVRRRTPRARAASE